MRLRRSHTLVLAVLLGAAVVAPTPATAQRVAAALLTAPSTWNTLVHDLSSGRTVWSAPGAMVRGVLTADGRYLLYWRAIQAPTGGVDLLLADTVGGSSELLSFDFEPWLAHPRDLAVYGLTRKRTTGFGTSVGVLARLDGSGLHELGGCPADSTASFAISVDGGTIGAVCESGDVAVVDATTGNARRTIPAGARPYGGVAVTSGNTVVVARVGSGTSDSAARFDAGTGALLSAVGFPPGGLIGSTACTGRIAVSAADGRLVMTCSVVVPSVPSPRTLSATRVLDPSLGSWGEPIGDFGSPYYGSVDPEGNVLTATWANEFGSEFVQMELETGTPRRTYGGVLALATAYAPLPPTLAVAISGSRVDLSWTLPVHSPPATRYVLDVGSASGLSNLGTIEAGSGSTFGATGVPAGTYFVRLRAVNYGGTSAASNELRIDVP